MSPVTLACQSNHFAVGIFFQGFNDILVVLLTLIFDTYKINKLYSFSFLALPGALHTREHVTLALKLAPESENSTEAYQGIIITI